MHPHTNHAFTLTHTLTRSFSYHHTAPSSFAPPPPNQPPIQPPVTPPPSITPPLPPSLGQRWFLIHSFANLLAIVTCVNSMVAVLRNPTEAMNPEVRSLLYLTDGV